MIYAFEEKKTLNNYFGKLISIVKTFMNWAFNRGLHNYIEFHKLKRVENEIEVIYLEKEELLKLYEFDFNNNRLNRARDFSVLDASLDCAIPTYITWLMRISLMSLFN